MSTLYTVKEGDYLNKIARDHGYADWRELYHHPDNAEFRAKRPNPDRIYPGDQLWLPSKQPTETPTSPQPSTPPVALPPPLVGVPDLWTKVPPMPTDKGLPQVAPLYWQVLQTWNVPGQSTTVVLPYMIHLFFQSLPGASSELVIQEPTVYEVFHDSPPSTNADSQVARYWQGMYTPETGVVLSSHLFRQEGDHQPQVFLRIWGTLYRIEHRNLQSLEDSVRAASANEQLDALKMFNDVMLEYLGYAYGYSIVPGCQMFHIGDHKSHNFLKKERRFFPKVDFEEPLPEGMTQHSRMSFMLDEHILPPQNDREKEVKKKPTNEKERLIAQEEQLRAALETAMRRRHIPVRKSELMVPSHQPTSLERFDPHNAIVLPLWTSARHPFPAVVVSRVGRNVFITADPDPIMPDVDTYGNVDRGKITGPIVGMTAGQTCFIELIRDLVDPDVPLYPVSENSELLHASVRIRLMEKKKSTAGGSPAEKQSSTSTSQTPKDSNKAEASKPKPKYGQSVDKYGESPPNFQLERPGSNDNENKRTERFNVTRLPRYVEPVEGSGIQRIDEFRDVEELRLVASESVSGQQDVQINIHAGRTTGPVVGKTTVRIYEKIRIPVAFVLVATGPSLTEVRAPFDLDGELERRRDRPSVTRLEDPFVKMNLWEILRGAQDILTCAGLDLLGSSIDDTRFELKVMAHPDLFPDPGFLDLKPVDHGTNDPLQLPKTTRSRALWNECSVPHCLNITIVKDYDDSGAYLYNGKSEYEPQSLAFTRRHYKGETPSTKKRSHIRTNRSPSPTNLPAQALNVGLLTMEESMASDSVQRPADEPQTGRIARRARASLTLAHEIGHFLGLAHVRGTMSSFGLPPSLGGEQEDVWSASNLMMGSNPTINLSSFFSRWFTTYRPGKAARLACRRIEPWTTEASQIEVMREYARNHWYRPNIVASGWVGT